MNQRPLASGLLLCEQVIVEEYTRNVTPVNCFSQKEVPSFPAEPFPFVILAFLIDGLGKIAVEATIQRLDDLDEIFRRSFVAEFPDPLQSYRLTVRVRDCSFPGPGSYWVTLTADQELIAQRQLIIVAKGGGS